MEMQSNIDNRKEVRKLVQEIFAKPEAFKAILENLKGYDSFKLPAKAEGAEAP